SSDMFFSVIIPAFNEAGQIGSCIDSIKTNKVEGVQLEIIVVDNCSTDSTVEVAREHGAKVIEDITGNISTMRNTGVSAANGEIYAFLDADMKVPADWLKTSAEYFAGGFTGAMGFVDRVPNGAGWVARTWGSRKYLSPEKVVEVDFLTSRNLLVNRSVFSEINGFDTLLETSEDKDFVYRIIKAGYRAISIPGLDLIHLGYEKGLFEFVRKEYWRQNSTLKVAKKMGYSFRTLRNPLLSLWHIFFLALTLLCIIFGSPRIIFYAALVLILPTLMITIANPGRKNAPPWFLVSYFMLSFLRWNVAGISLVGQLIKGDG
ncbi:MAG: glycosyltransferase, partial [Thermodesulfobacteriota bacterium]